VSRLQGTASDLARDTANVEIEFRAQGSRFRIQGVGLAGAGELWVS